MNERKEKQPQKRHYTQHCKLLSRFPKHTLLPFQMAVKVKINQVTLLYI